MVWNSSGSALYSAVERHNSGLPDSAVCEPCSAPDTEPQQPQCECRASHSPEPHEPPHCPKCACASNQPRPCPSQHGLEALLNDKDFLLLAALMLLLLHEKADNKLILALAFVMFG